MSRRAAHRALGVVLLVAAAAIPAGASALAPETERALAASTYVYVASERKGGGFGSPAEIWFMWDQGAVWVASPATTWRAKRIRAGRPTARIAVGSRNGPTFTATGSFLRDPAVYERLFTTFAKKYPAGWPQYEARFRDGLKDGSRVLMRYEPIAPAARAPVPTQPTTAPTTRP